MQKEYSLTFDLMLCLAIMTVQRGQRPTSHVVRTSSYLYLGLMSYPHLEKHARWCECPSYIPLLTHLNRIVIFLHREFLWRVKFVPGFVPPRCLSPPRKWLFNPGTRLGAGVLTEDDQVV